MAPLPVTDLSDVVGISVAIAPTHPESNLSDLSDACDTPPDAPTLLLSTLAHHSASVEVSADAHVPSQRRQKQMTTLNIPPASAEAGNDTPIPTHGRQTPL